MSFSRRNQALFFEGVDLTEIAQKVGTPTFVYSANAIDQQYLSYKNAFAGIDARIRYAVKANSNIAILNRLAKLGSGFDLVSMGELFRVIKAGGDPKDCIFSGVGKSKKEIEYALDCGVMSFNVESEAELHSIAQVAQAHEIVVPISLRINPNVDAKTHPYISTGLKENKFGVDKEFISDLYRYCESHRFLSSKGIAMHIGSQITELSPYKDSLKILFSHFNELNDLGIKLGHIDIGGGLGIRYQDEQPIAIEDFATTVIDSMHRYLDSDNLPQINIEPGRSLVGNAGVLLSKSLYSKKTGDKNFLVIDAAMNDLIRPALYQGWHKIEPLSLKSNIASTRYDVVGPICESADFLAKERDLAIEDGDYLAIHSCGAYAFSMSSNYNTRPKSAEVLVENARYFIIRERETLEDLVRGEKIPTNNL